MPELTDTNDLKQRIVEESKKYLNAEPEANEFTAEFFMKANEIDRNAVYRTLDKMIRDGVCYMRKGRLNGSSVNVYGFKE